MGPSKGPDRGRNLGGLARWPVGAPAQRRARKQRGCEPPAPLRPPARAHLALHPPSVLRSSAPRQQSACRARRSARRGAHRGAR
eukprot:1395395-Pyramimonas_sp.AAC.1